MDNWNQLESGKGNTDTLSLLWEDTRILRQGKERF